MGHHIRILKKEVISDFEHLIVVSKWLISGQSDITHISKNCPVKNIKSDMLNVF